MAMSTEESFASPSGGSTRRQIETVAAELFYRRGYGTTSVREILAAVGMTPGALYNHFRSKEELLYSIASRTCAELERQLAAAVRRGGGEPARELWEAARTMTEFHTTYRMEAVVTRSESARLPLPQATEVGDSERRIRREFERMLEQGRERGVFRLSLPDDRPADIPVTAKAMLDLCIHAGLWFRPEGRLSAEEIAEQYGVLVLQAAGVTHAEIQSVSASVPR
ncbi:TetR/AcrR family transcriptional regulator [Streptomyces sp. HC44]|uniref:TetR/AcrR family transcriptional regulator n=1 Tax=Streptomyces scabichelini TaxID=2711217 RepID=A0A6G4VBW9_9ACTN|nr:TetR/AcrR family transcriptional regulator [Streptomyces scabichelini]NGO11589.1 TetR/AcrR family transcriptional regulator [Streptomyces scabichelini]